jgi:hypothetical protein
MNTLIVILAVVIAGGLILLYKHLDRVSSAEEVERESFKSTFTLEQETEFSKIKSWYLIHTNVIPNRKDYLEGKYESTLDYLLAVETLEKRDRTAEDFRAIMSGSAPSSRPPIRGRKDSAEGMPFFNN